jgi:Domain of unknown function DUF302
MPTKQITVERFSIVSLKPFGDILTAIEKQIGHPDIRKFIEQIAQSKTEADLETIVRAAVGPTDLMEFIRFDQGEVLRKEIGENAPRVVRLLVGNPLTMKKMVKVVPDAGSYAPATILIDERADGVHISYDRVASFLGSYGDPEALKVAQGLDSTVESLLEKAAN